MRFKDREITILALNDERVLYNCKFDELQPPDNRREKKYLCMSRKGFDARFGYA